MSISRPNVWIDSVVFNDGSKVSFSHNDIVVVVGPNNSGKSEFLREISKRCEDARIPRVVASDIQVSIDDNPNDIIEWIKSMCMVSYENRHKKYLSRNGTYTDPELEMTCSSFKTHGFRDCNRFIVFELKTEDRLSSTRPVQNIDYGTNVAENPIQMLYEDDILENKISSVFRKGFGVDLIVDKSRGATISLVVGERPLPQGDEDRASKSYLDRIRSLPKLEEQGDGMRSFTGVLLNYSLSSEPILLIDEPEAFLHPPQARLLGEILSNESGTEKQIFIATHSTDIIQGIINKGERRARIVRIQRRRGVNAINELRNETLIEIFSDTLLRYSNILDGIFFDHVIVCESDSDCRFFSAILDEIIKKRETKCPDIKFIHTSGKHRLNCAIRALKSLGVPTSVIADIDILDDKNTFQEIINALGGDWDQFDHDHKTLSGQIKAQSTASNPKESISNIELIIKQFNNLGLPSEEALKRIKNASSLHTPWAKIKRAGASAIPRGDGQKSFDSIHVSARNIGLHILRCGELEGFYPSFSNHGQEWVNAVLEEVPISNLKDAIEFMNDVLLQIESTEP
jgi:predicted ATPase